MNQLARVVVGLSVAIALTWSQRTEACGCFAPPNAAEPIVQAGERILFSVKDGKVTAHIQIQYAGEAKDFGWLLPLPSIPTLKIGSDELFTQLGATTQPSYSVTQVPGTPCRGGGSGGVPLFACGSPVALSRGSGEFGPVVAKRVLGRATFSRAITIQRNIEIDSYGHDSFLSTRLRIRNHVQHIGLSTSSTQERPFVQA